MFEWLRQSTKQQDMVNKFMLRAAILGLLIFVAGRANSAQPDMYNIRFHSLTTQNGLSRALVKAMETDDFGFLWVATENGLNRYDGYQFKIFRNLASDSSSLPDNDVISLCNVPGKGLFVGMKSGRLSRYNPYFDRFENIRFHDSIANYFRDAEPDDMLVDAQKVLWIATTNGLFAYDTQSEKAWLFNLQNSGLASKFVKNIFIDHQQTLWLATDAGLAKVFNHQHPDKATIVTLSLPDLPGTFAKGMAQDDSGLLWLGVDGGLCSIDLEQEKVIEVFTHNPLDGQSLGNNYIKAIVKSNDGTIWIGHDMGVSVYDPKTKIFQNYQAGYDDEFGLVNNYVKCFLKDKNNIIWIGTDLGISYYDPIKEPFRSFTHQPGKTGKLSGNIVYGLFEDAPDSLWLATNNGLNLWNPLTNNVQVFKNEPNNVNSLSSNIVRSVLRDKNGVLWVGTDNGLNRMVKTPLGSLFIRIGAEPGNPWKLNNGFVVTLKECSDGNLWIGTWGGGVNVLDTKTMMFNYLIDNASELENKINNNQIANIFEDSKRQVWLRSGNIFDLNTQTMQQFPFKEQALNINFFFEDRQGRMWIGTSSDGLCYYEPGTDHLKHLQQHRILNEGVVVSMRQDKSGTYWVAVNKNIVQMSADLQEIHVFDDDDGLQNGDFSNEAAIVGSDGKLFFGGSKGLSYFFPEKILLNEKPIPVFLTGLKLFNNTMVPESGSLLDTALILKQRLILPYDHKELVFNFTGINFTNSSKNSYAFKVEGLQSEWVYTSSENRNASYFQLPPGNYTFKVKGANNSGVWNENETSIEIVVLPPWYRLWWVHLIGLLLLIVMIYLIIIVRTRKLNTQKLILEEKVKKRTTELARQNVEIELKNQQLEEASKAKSEFLANMSHEIRTPLNGVIGFTDLVLKTELDSTQKEYLHIVGQSAESLLNIINDILDFSKIEAGKLELYIEKTDLQEIGYQSADLINFQAQRKGLEVLLQVPPQLPRFVYADVVRLKQVLVNLLSNAVKFTEEGEVALKIEILELTNPDNAIFRFSVRDTGIGIKPEKMNLIFEAFTQEDSSTTKRFGGTGLGLTISNKLLAMMNSKLQLESEAGKGSTFFFDIPLRFEYGAVEKIDNFDKIHKVLIVDDNKNNRHILKEMLGHLGIESVESDGYLTAFEVLAANKDVDVVFMDYHMPDKDGLQLVSALRKTKGYLQPSTPVVIWHSTLDDNDFIQQCEQLGIHNRLVKPVKQKTLVQMLRRISSQQPVDDIIIQKESRSYSDVFNILIVEDNPVNLLLAKSILHKILPNAVLHEALHGGHAVAFCQENSPDFVFMDIQMPVMNGYEATTAIKQLPGFKDVPVVALTAGNVKGEKEKCFDAGMCDFVTKPVIEQTITETIEKWLQPKELLLKEKASAPKAPKVVVKDRFSMEMLKEDLGDDRVFLHEFLLVLKESLVQAKSDLRLQLVNADHAALKAAAHKLKGTAFSINLESLSQLAQQLEIAEDIQSEEVINQVEAITQSIDDLLPQVEQELKNYSD